MSFHIVDNRIPFLQVAWVNTKPDRDRFSMGAMTQNTIALQLG
jgi:hypothetical protein